ncbi:hypothetical protein BD770DRAFT_287861, partial [Pilaira anomala]
SDTQYQRFFTNLKALTVRSFDKPSFDLEPVLSTLKSWGDNDSLTPEQLTRKVCFLLAITGFLRPSDLQRVHLDKTLLLGSSQLKLVIDCPKEKRMGSPIERVVLIHSHPDHLLCPVRAYQAYRSRIAITQCLGPHPARPSRTIAFLVRNLNDFSLAVTSQTIGRHIRSLLSLVLVNDNCSSGPLRARAIGSTNAAINGANLDDILVHGSWASSCVFDNFYRLSRATASNFTTLALSSS